MRYMIRETYNCRRGKVPEYLEDLKIINDMFIKMGNSTGKIYVDITERLDTVYHTWEVDSLDEYFSFERGIYVDTEADTRALIDRLNENAVAGHREIYEVIV